MLCILGYVENVDIPDPPDLQSVLARLAELEIRLAAAEAELKRKDQIIDALQKRLFGSSSERLDPAQLQLEFEDGLLGKPEALPETGDAASAPEESEKGAKRIRRKKTDLFPRNLKIVIDEVLIPDQVAAHPEDFKEIGEEHHDELDIVRAAMFWRRTVRKKFVSKQDRSLPPIITSAPEPSLPGTLCAPALAAQIVVDKYCDHLPHYRQSMRFLRQHSAQIGRQTLNSWTHAVARHLAPIAEAIKEELFYAHSLQVDETTISYLSPGHGQTKTGYLWVYLDVNRDVSGDEQDAVGGGTVVYDWQEGRGLDCLLDIIGIDEVAGTTHFQGIVQCDGYSAYQSLVKRYRGIRLAGCLAHIRRKFHDARGQSPQIVQPILRSIQRLYRIEHHLREQKVPPDCRKLIRLARSRPIVERLKQTIIEQEKTGNHLPESNLGKAIRYALGQWEKFELYLHNGGLEIDNNLVENAIRPTKIGAKNYLFFGSAEAGKHNALLYTLIENCKLQHLDPELYLAEVIKALPEHPTAEQAANLTPRQVAKRRQKANKAAA